MFERLTDRARRSVVLAQQAAQNLQASEIGTTHLLLGLVQEGEGVAASVLAELGVTYDDILDQCEHGTGHVPNAPFTANGKRVFEFALREALQLGCNYIGTEHMLLGVIRDGKSRAAQMIERYEALDVVKQDVIATLGSYAPLSTPTFQSAEKDAWLQEHELHERFSKEWSVRPDLEVTALACGRAVRFTLIESDPSVDRLDKRHKEYHSTTRSVATMRELAEALLAACDFVEHSNPRWAERIPE